jgi:hypothetical protein
VAAALALVLASACTKVLGIDGTYVLRQVREDGSASTASGGAGAGGAGGDNGDTGGTTSSADASIGGAGGAGGTGGTGGIGGAGGENAGGRSEDAYVPVEAATPTDACGPSCNQPPDCKTGHYAGTFTGTHAPEFTFVGVPFTMAGNLSFTLAGSGGSLVANGTFNGTLQTTPSFPVSGTMVGTYDCATHVLNAVLSGQFGLQQPAPAIPIHGVLSGDMSSSRSSDRTWQDAEANTPLPGNATILPAGTGRGTWAVTSRP